MSAYHKRMGSFEPTLAALLLSTAALAACGGGAGGSTPPGDAGAAPAPGPDPVPSLRVSVAGSSSLLFEWSGGQNVGEYRLLESADGEVGFKQVDSFMPTTRNHQRNVFLPARVNARYVLQACNIDGCTDSNVETVQAGLARAAKRVVASVPGHTDNLGIGIALSANGSTLAVGSHQEDSDAAAVAGAAGNSGAVYVYTRENGNWVQQALLKASNAEAQDHFGASLALSADGNTLAVGAPEEDSHGVGVNDPRTGSNLTRQSGAAYVFVREGGAWTQQAYVKASNTFSYWDNFGRQLSLSGDGNTLAVGAAQEDSNATGIDSDQSNDGAIDAGAVYVFARSGSTWAQQAYVKASNTAADDQFGASLALNFDGSTLAVGAMGEDSGIDGNQTDDSAPSSGAVYVFTRDGTAWAQQAYLKASNGDASDQFGVRVALSADGHTLAVGAYLEDSSATGVAGDTQDNSTPDSGAVYVFVRSGSAWEQQAYLKASNTGASDWFGSALSLSADGNLLAVGARLEDSHAIGIGGDQTTDVNTNSGAVYVFARISGGWAQQAYLKSSGDPGALVPGQSQRDSNFGVSVDFADDGSALAIGAFFEDHSGLPEPGAAYVY